MNARILACLLAGTMGGLGARTTAQDAPRPQPSAQGASYQNMRELHNAERQLARLTKKLKLSAKQQDEIKPILEDRETQIRELRRDHTLSRADRGEKAKDILEAGDSKVEALLDDRQRQIFEKDQQARQRRMGQRSGDDSSMDDSPPPPPDDSGGPPDGGPPPDDGGPPEGGPPVVNDSGAGGSLYRGEPAFDWALRG